MKNSKIYKQQMLYSNIEQTNNNFYYRYRKEYKKDFLVNEGTSFYEIDKECMRKKKLL